MKKYLLLIVILIFAINCTFAEEGYVSPETYAINEGDLTDYYDIPAPKRLDIDHLDEKPSKQTVYNEENTTKPEKEKKVKGEKKPYEKTLKYKTAKWWVDQRYKREEVHHGTKHEIKVKAREEYEKQQAELQSQKEKP